MNEIESRSIMNSDDNSYSQSVSARGLWIYAYVKG